MTRVMLLDKFAEECCENVIAAVMVVDPMFAGHVSALGQLHRTFNHLPIVRLKKILESRTIAGPPVKTGRYNYST